MTDVPSNARFIMHSARNAVSEGMLHVEEQVKALEQAVEDNTGLVFDLARTLIESTCKTIITERGGSFSSDDNLPSLFRTVRQSLPFMPEGLEDESGARKSLDCTLSGLYTVIHGICELRNNYGFASHGSDSPRPAMEVVQALLVAQAADAIVGFLYRSHRQDRMRARIRILKFDHNPTFNDWLDEQCEPVQILALPSYRPSEVLFAVDEQAYRVILSEYKGEPENSVSMNEDGQEGGE